MAKKEIGQIFKLNISISLSIIIILAVFATINLYFYFPLHRDDIKFIAALIGGAAGIYSAYYAGRALRDQIDREKQKACFEILSMLNRPEFVEVRKFIKAEVNNPDEIADTALFQKVNSSPRLESAITTVFGILEDASIAVQSDYVDEDCLYLSIHWIVKNNFRGLKGYIDQARSLGHHPKFYIELEHLYNSWESGKRLSDGRPLPK